MIAVSVLSKHTRNALPEASPAKVDFLVKKLLEFSEAMKVVNEILVKAFAQLEKEDDVDSGMFLCDQFCQSMIAASASFFCYPVFTQETEEEVMKVAYQSYKQMRVELSLLTLDYLKSKEDEKKTPSS